MPVTRRKSNDLPDDIRRQADAGPVVMPDYTVLSREDWDRLIDLAIDEREFKIAYERYQHGEPDGATLEVMCKKYGL
jgi:hypothetical protein